MWHLPLIWLLETEHASRTSRATRDVISLLTDLETDFHQVLFKTVLCSALKLARLTNNYAVLMMFSPLSRSHQQSSISGCCAVFVWKSHPVCMTSASSDQEEASWGNVLAPIPNEQGLLQKCAAAYHQLTPHVIGVLIWFDSCFRPECHGLGSVLQPTRAVVTADQQWMKWERRRGVCTSTNGRNSRRKTALMRGSWNKLDAQAHLISATVETKKTSANSGGQWPWTERGKGEMIL